MTRREGEGGSAQSSLMHLVIKNNLFLHPMNRPD